MLSILYLCSLNNNPQQIFSRLDWVVNCFQFCIFALWTTTCHMYCIFSCCCELLSILYLCSLNNNCSFVIRSLFVVVNCFQFCIFALWTTTWFIWGNSGNGLWIAFNFVSLLFEQQPKKDAPAYVPGCELLSILYLCSLNNNIGSLLFLFSYVVNCFQFCIFALWTTTYLYVREVIGKLWIAFNFVSLLFEQQQKRFSSYESVVVNCFQFCIFALWTTTVGNVIGYTYKLWIAFNFVSLLFEQQHIGLSSKIRLSCELLSILYLCSLNNNLITCKAKWIKLWIAFNFVSLLFEQQQSLIYNGLIRRCELLSILYLCSLNNNRIVHQSRFFQVVNCFQFCIFALWTTTKVFRVWVCRALWIAFNFVSLLFEQQLMLRRNK